MCTITKVFPQGAFATLDEYGDKKGMIHISEVSSGWVKNIRNFVREGQKLVCKVLAVDERKGHIDLSLRRVKDSQRRLKVQQLKQKQKAEKLVELTAGQLGKSLDEARSEVILPLREKFGDLYSALETLANKGKDELRGVVGDKWVDALAGVVGSITKPSVFEIGAYLKLNCPAPNGVDVLRSAMLAAKDSNRQEGVKIQLSYLGSPKYRLKVEAGSYKDAEAVLRGVAEQIITEIGKSGGEGELLEVKKV